MIFYKKVFSSILTDCSDDKTNYWGQLQKANDHLISFIYQKCVHFRKTNSRENLWCQTPIESTVGFAFFTQAIDWSYISQSMNLFLHNHIV